MSLSNGSSGVSARLPGGGERVRVRVMRFGEHLLQSGPRGALLLVPSRAPMELVQGLLLRGAYGDGVDFAAVDFSFLHIYLLPDGDLVTAAGARGGGGGG